MNLLLGFSVWWIGIWTESKLDKKKEKKKRKESDVPKIMGFE
jgi:hypothetical protein